jgi:hypothetical protein
VRPRLSAPCCSRGLSRRLMRTVRAPPSRRPPAAYCCYCGVTVLPLRCDRFGAAAAAAAASDVSRVAAVASRPRSSLWRSPLRPHHPTRRCWQHWELAPPPPPLAALRSGVATRWSFACGGACRPRSSCRPAQSPIHPAPPVTIDTHPLTSARTEIRSHQQRFY